jgi:hypothetical protein
VVESAFFPHDKTVATAGGIEVDKRDARQVLEARPV